MAVRKKVFCLGKIKLRVSKNTIYITVKDKEFYAAYPFDMEETPNDLLEALVYVLFVGLEDVPIPQKEKNRDGDQVILSFSGGADSLAAHELIPSIPIYLHRDYLPDYGLSQQDIIKNTRSVVINNNMELIRKLYDKPHGFNWGYGYASLILPLMDRYNATHIIFGTGYMRNVDKKNRHHYDALRNIGIHISNPTGCIYEVLTSKIASYSKHGMMASSCHHTYKKICGSCLKCLRKQGFAGKKITLTNKLVTALDNPNIFKKIGVPLVYALQKVDYGYDNDILKSDVSFAERYDHKRLLTCVHPELQSTMLNSFRKFSITPMTTEDYKNKTKYYNQL